MRIWICWLRKMVLMGRSHRLLRDLDAVLVSVQKFLLRNNIWNNPRCLRFMHRIGKLLAALKDQVLLNQRSTNASILVENRPLWLWVSRTFWHGLDLQRRCEPRSFACSPRISEWHLDFGRRTLLVRSIEVLVCTCAHSRVGLTWKFEFLFVHHHAEL